MRGATILYSIVGQDGILRPIGGALWAQPGAGIFRFEERRQHCLRLAAYGGRNAILRDAPQRRSVAGFTYDLTTSRKTYTKSAVRPNAVVTIAAAAHRSSTSSHSGQAMPKPGGPSLKT
jgi:hypothetical protein